MYSGSWRSYLEHSWRQLEAYICNTDQPLSYVLCGVLIFRSSELEACGAMDWSDLKGQNLKTGGLPAYGRAKLFLLVRTVCRLSDELLQQDAIVQCLYRPCELACHMC